MRTRRLESRRWTDREELDGNKDVAIEVSVGPMSMNQLERRWNQLRS